MNLKQTFARLVWWRYWKQPQYLFLQYRTPKPYGLYNILKVKNIMNTKKELISKLNLHNVNGKSTTQEIIDAINLHLENRLKQQYNILTNENIIKVNSVDELIEQIKNETNKQPTPVSNPKLLNKLSNFFKNDIGVKEFAKQLRLLEYIAKNLFLQQNDLYKDKFLNATFWINHFAETIDPYFEKE